MSRVYTMHSDVKSICVYPWNEGRKKINRNKRNAERENRYRRFASEYFSTSLNAACCISRLHGDCPKNAPLQLCASKHGSRTISSYLEQQFTIASTHAESGLFGFPLFPPAAARSCCEMFVLSVVVVDDSESCYKWEKKNEMKSKENDSRAHFLLG